ncbi:MAG TPA: sugar kinase [Acetobacteraceae bacterium]|jgi:sugar/nucleoside kinase (ribokinase family)|nr:sugar kinase [Acetobacteraceae bacterium]
MTLPPVKPGKIVTMGEILVDIMAVERGRGFREALNLRGPFPGGAPAIFVSQVARLGHPAGIIAGIGDDDFGWLTIERLKRDGVDVSAVRIDDDCVTATAFVRYREDGERDFLFNLARSAAGRVELNAPARALLAECGHFHIMGSSLFSFHLIDEVKKAVEIVKANGATVSFDPNIRKEMMDIAEMRAGIELMLQYCDIFLPSGPELLVPTAAHSEEEAIAALFSLGISMIVVKRAARGASYYDHARALDLPGYKVAEIDPTGAGDCFGATFITCLRQGMDPEACVRTANAAGALAVSRQGGMEGISSLAEMEALIARAAVSENELTFQMKAT